MLLHLAAIVESSHDAIISTNLDDAILSWNPTATRLFGYEPDEVMGKSTLILIPAELRSQHTELLDRIKSGERIEQYEVTRVRKDGERVAVAATVSPIRDHAGQVIGVSYIARSVSDRRHNEEARLRLAAIVESSEDAIISKDLNGIIKTWNAAATRLFGYEPDEIIGQPVLRLIPPELQYEEPEILRKLRAGQRIEHYETQRIRKNGERFDVSLTISPIKDESGHVIGASKSVRDISEQKRAEAALIESEKMAATGRMAAALAHEVNNPLESITNLAYLLSQHTSLPPDARQWADLLLSEVGRASEIAKRTLTFYRQTTVPVEVHIDEILDSLVQFLRTKLAAKQLRVRTEYKASGFLLGFPTELRQVLANLLANAIDASSRGGEIRIRTTDSHAGDGGNMRITIADQGHGIPPNLRKRLFEPFFTTKEHKGHGLGLWVTRSIVRKHNGRIRVRSSVKPGCGGTVFSVVLPCRFQHPARSQPSDVVEPSAA